jgi:chorismate-pyruvate lyase
LLRSPLRFQFQLKRERSSNLRDWVNVPGSMTRAIATTCGQQPTVDILSEGPDRASRWEARLIGKPAGYRVHAREISLRVGDNTVLVARSITPAGSSVEPLLRGLGSKPLAELLFVDPRWQRHHAPLALYGDDRDELPGRVCVWNYAARQPGTLLVAEYFLPSLLALPPR